MTTLIDYKDRVEELGDQIMDIIHEIEYRQVELTGHNNSSAYERGRRFDHDEEILSRDIVYNYLKLKLEETKRNKEFLEIYGTNVYDAEKQYNEWREMANIKKEDEE